MDSNYFLPISQSQVEPKINTEILKTPSFLSAFHTHQCIQRHILDSYFEFDVTIQFNLLRFDIPVFVFVMFLFDREYVNQKKNSNKFDFIKVSTAYLKNAPST